MDVNTGFSWEGRARLFVFRGGWEVEIGSVTGEDSFHPGGSVFSPKGAERIRRRG